VVLELLESGDRDLARGILRSSDPLLALKTSHVERYTKLEHFCKRPFFNSSDAYEMGSTKELRRQEIADSLACEVSVVEPARLLSLLGQALKFQQSQNLLPAGVPFDVFRNARKATKRDVEEKTPKRSGGIIRSTCAQKVDSLVFSPDGQCLVSGSAEGLVEGWDVESFSLRQDLEHQAKGECIDLGGAVLCSTFSRDGEMLATGSSSGQIKVWKLSTGVCVRAFTQAHPEGVTSVCFYRDGTRPDGPHTRHEVWACFEGVQRAHVFRQLRPVHQGQLQHDHHRYRFFTTLLTKNPLHYTLYIYYYNTLLKYPHRLCRWNSQAVGPALHRVLAHLPTGAGPRLRCDPRARRAHDAADAQ
jgi:hypothetical protein